MPLRHTQPYEDRLRALREQLLAQVRQQRGGTLGRAEVAADRFDNDHVDRAQFSTEHDLDLALGERETQTLLEIDAALARIRAGRFGLCVDCGAVIVLARLQLNPYAARCLACQRQYERSHPLLP